MSDNNLEIKKKSSKMKDVHKKEKKTLILALNLRFHIQSNLLSKSTGVAGSGFGF